MVEAAKDHMTMMPLPMRITASPPIRLAILAPNLDSREPKVSTPPTELPQGEPIDDPFFPYSLAEPLDDIPHAPRVPPADTDDPSHAQHLPLEQVLHHHQDSQLLIKSDELCLNPPEVSGTAPFMFLDVPVPPPPSLNLSESTDIKLKFALCTIKKDNNCIICYTSLCHT